MSKIEEKFKIPPIITSEKAVKEALKRVQQERTGDQIGLYTRFENLNRAFLKYIRPGYVTMIAGLSGSGKSAVLNMLRHDFTDKVLNGGFVNFSLLRVLDFDFEMFAADQMLRYASSDIGVPYASLLSSNYDKKTGNYNTINDERYKKIEQSLLPMINREIHTINEALTLKQMDFVIETFYQVQLRKNNNNHITMVICIDHALLIKHNGDENRMLAELGVFSQYWAKKYNAIIIILNQLNKEIEDPQRRLKRDLHYPGRNDIYGSTQLWNSMDNVIIYHRPEKINIVKYGPHGLNTLNLIHGGFVKSRFGKTGDLWFINKLHEGKIEETAKDYFQ